jgi:SAM-dependent methyltransferase
VSKPRETYPRVAAAREHATGGGDVGGRSGDYGDTAEIATEVGPSDAAAPVGVSQAEAQASETDGSTGRVPISLSDGGDFSTPVKRRRVITRPRGMPVLEPPVPPAIIEGKHLIRGAESPEARAVAGASPAAATPSAAPMSAVDEFLAAPPTPAPELEGTPPPELEPEPASVGTSSPAGGIDDGFRVEVAVSDETAAVVDPEKSLVDDLLAQAADLIAPAPRAHTPRREATPVAERHIEEQPFPGSGPAVVVEAVVDSGRAPSPAADEPAFTRATSVDGEISPLAQTLAHMAETIRVDVEHDVSEEIEIVDAPLVPLPQEALTSGPPARPLGPPPLPPEGPPPIPAGAEGSSKRFSLPPLAGLPEALAERPRRPKRSKPWFEEVFDEDYLRTLPFMTSEQTLREVDFIESCLGIPKDGEVLDVGCGYGRHAIELVQRGLRVTGLDLSLPLLIRAADESHRRSLSVNFVHSDMREMAFERKFDGAYCMLTSFGYFDEESNLKVAEGVARALKPQGRFLVDVLNRDYVVGDLPTRVWWEGDGCVVLEEVDFNFNTSRLVTRRSVVFEDGRQLEQEISVRAYSLHELGKLLRQSGFRVLEVSGSIPTRGYFFGATSRHLIVLAEKRAD